MIDERVRHGRRLRRLRRSSRRWSVVAGTLGGAAVVLAPYSGLGLMDAVWAAAAGGAAVLSGWRWADYRALAAQPEPPPSATADSRDRVEALAARVPGGRELLAELRRQVDRARLRGSAVAPGWRRLDRASAVLNSLPLRPGGPGDAARLEAAAAERELRALARRVAGVERGLPYSASHETLGQAVSAMVTQFEQGVTAYEELVGAAAAHVAQEGRMAPEHPSVSQLTEATDMLRGITLGLAELHARAPS